MHSLSIRGGKDREESAAYWVMIMSGPDVPAHLERLFESWMCANPENALAYAECLASYDSDVARETSRQVHAQRQRTSPGLWGGALAAGLAIALVGIGLLTGSVHLPDKASPATGYNQTLATTPGQILTARLPDGSLVSLNGDTRISVHFEGHDRSLHLEKGEAYFDIAHDATRPFVVEAANAKVRVLGTAFNIDLLPTGEAEVAVYRGRVRVQIPGQMRDLGVGERILTDAVLLPVAFEASEAPDWQGGWFEADNISLSRLIAEVNRFSSVPVRIDAAKLAESRVSGRFKVSDTEMVLRGLKQVYGVKIRREKNVIVLMK